MLTDSDKIDEVAERSKQIEENTYLEEIAESYDHEFDRATELFDAAAEQTNNFRDISKESIRADPRIVMILRYLVKPTISQMKFGQFVGVRSTGNYEDFDKSDVTTPNNKTAQSIAQFVTENIDAAKVPWLFNENVTEEEEYVRSRQWICDKIAERTAETRYRNWRAAKQERSIENALERAGYEESDYVGTVTSKDDLEIGTYVDERKVAGDDTQKADIIFRPREDLIVFVEAKAMGVALDAYKRSKEVRDKATGWCGAFDDAQVMAVIEGGLDGDGVRKLMNHVDVYIEHRLEEEFVPDVQELQEDSVQ